MESKMETKKSFLNNEMTRRQFMKISGKSLAGLALSASTLKLLGGATAKQVEAGQVSVVATPKGLLVVNADLCVQCLRCESNCTTVNDGTVSSYSSRVKITRNLMYNENGVGLYADLEEGWNAFPDTCRQCADAPCAQACPVNAIEHNDEGVYVVDEDRCIGCRLCEPACPWAMININPDTNKAVKCNLCETCIEGCPSGALYIVPWDQVTAEAQLPWRG